MVGELMAMGVFGILFVLFWVLFVGIMLAGFVFWIFMIVDVSRRNFPKSDDRILWILVVVLAGMIGAAVYYFVVVRKGKKK